jgi:uncharacterized protein YebE (UPF0316 family)
MFDPEFLQSDLFNWVVLPLLIFLARMTDVTLGTLRHLFIAKGLRKIVPFVGFFEVLIWLIAMGQIMQNLNNAACYFAWAGGFAMGTFVGMFIEEKLALGMQVLRVITNQDCAVLLEAFRNQNLGSTVVDGQGAKGPVKIIFAIVKRKDLPQVLQMLHEHNPNSFYTIEDVRNANQGVFPGAINQPDGKFPYFRKLFPVRKGK